MRHLGFGKLSGAIVILTAAVIVAAPVAEATPNPNSAYVKTRVFNDEPFSTLSVNNSYPAFITISDQKTPGAGGFANRHIWRYSEDGGATPAQFANGDHYRACADLTIRGTGQGEAGLQLTPWWSAEVDGIFNVRTTDGEIAIFGGRMPFYNFTASHGINYVKGNTIHLEMIYDANSNTAADPATIEYKVVYNGNPYSSGPIAFDEGNPAEDPPHGLWGQLTPAYVGGFMQYFISGSGVDGDLAVAWENICFENLDAVPVQHTTWSNIKSLLAN